jgi:hypothetical protein
MLYAAEDETVPEPLDLTENWMPATQAVEKAQ